MKKNVLIFILGAIVFFGLGMGSYYLFFDKEDSEEITKNVEENQNMDEEDNTISEQNTDNSYSIFADGLKNAMKSNENDNNYNNYMYASNIDVCSNDGYEVFLQSDGSLYIKYIDESLNSKFGNYKLASDVLSFYLINVGQDLYKSLYFIKSDGTVSQALVNNTSSNEISVVNNVGNYKNIVSIISGSFGKESSVFAPIFIDINGNMYSENFDN